MQRYILLFFLLTVSIDSQAERKIKVSNAWIPANPPGVKVFAAYLTVHNQSDKTLTVNGFISKPFDKVEMHQTRIIKGVASMQKIERIEIKPGEKFHFKPGGYHLMLFRPAFLIRQGARIRLVMKYNRTGAFGFFAIVKPRTGHHHKHHH